MGGFDFINGYGVYEAGDIFGGYEAGDIFIDTRTIDASYGTDEYTGTGDGFKHDTTPYGYDYVLDMDYGATTPGYTIYRLNGDETFETAYYRQNDESNPWRYKIPENPSEIGSGAIETDFVTTGLGLEGGTHYAISVDLSPIWSDLGIDDPDFLAHLTIGCGNDNLMGLYEGGGRTPVPEPATMLLVGTGLVGLASLRKKFKKAL